ncbi:ABC transporter ATP-binding protein [Blastococcus sp. URHD0036]|uniref:ABC transporter ATP-binding protein n=1 Tax=Blastococcus sp. URHD0036 TaxID=1380356 RepID=UPI0009DF74E4|nr:ABC transporter ATP-binding protein [Blastococcus sp. URHD0036]
MTDVLRLSGITKSFVTGRTLLGKPNSYFHAVRGVTLSVARGETVAVVGESGAGKSTVGRLALRLIEPDDGGIEFNGSDLRAASKEDLRRLRGRMRMIFQDPYSSLDPSMVVGDTVAEPLLVHTKMSAAERRAKVLDLLQRVGMDTHHMDRFPYEFSGGQLQRIAIARAITTDPDLIVCDEPVAALDMSIRAQVVNLLRDLQVERGMAYLFITHDLSLVRLIADRVVVMYAGQIVESATTEQLFAEPRHPYTRALLAAVPVPDPNRRKSQTAIPLAAVQGKPPAKGCSFAPRCPLATEECTVEAPPLAEVAGHDVACYHADHVPVAELSEGAPGTPHPRTELLDPH